ncbi:hypothetical protein ASPACDRAFT_1858030 [Aspergillus aculeatus ATCC 16872]|uniref:Plectin/eS10 N-terminal domain-containing protein n=1 Tax=Aspergillus aculeatus (strain ATCC 16872 / CBS 172.66 / WB 5094) TaxID=690307 RepID=A0A1L9WPD2_ASPA1|nr:uncharacterized protein ASPACDRAFT_1858030 [Aspergillus aculeatus ATCC 16872]OJJ98013.1 hypothetical protein ASPACDRAFT_1858030 [Aspergillus aculeatus ATCC 16872]
MQQLHVTQPYQASGNRLGRQPYKRFRIGNHRTFSTRRAARSTQHQLLLNHPLRALLERFPEERQELATMLIPKEDRKKIHEYLFREGVLVAKKDFNLPKHGDIDTKNLYVIKALQSLDSRGYVKTRFSWQYYYYTLTPEGLDYLREWLHLPAEVVPATHIKQQRSHAPPRGMMGGEERERRPRAPREGGYRRREQGENKEGGAPGEFAPSFRGGFGRGRGAPSS